MRDVWEETNKSVDMQGPKWREFLEPAWIGIEKDRYREG
jgi:hypothetical protein